ncbi:hypothetical protein [Pseudomonas phage Hadban]|nr:hypothetical protein [Pseudomonas phage Hadban]
MVIREARYLSGNDLGKTIAVGSFDGILAGLDIGPDKITLYVSDNQLWGMKHVKSNTLVTITGKESKGK